MAGSGDVILEHAAVWGGGGVGRRSQGREEPGRAGWDVFTQWFHSPTCN